MKDNNTTLKTESPTFPAPELRNLPFFPAFIQASSYGDASYVIIAPTQQAHIRACALYSVISMLRYERAIIYTS